MPQKIQCPCGKSLRAPDELIGKRVRCPNCGAAIRVTEDTPDVEGHVRPPPCPPHVRQEPTAASPPKNSKESSAKSGQATSSTWSNQALQAEPGFPAVKTPGKRKRSQGTGTIVFLIAGVGMLVVTLILVVALVPIVINIGGGQADLSSLIGYRGKKSKHGFKELIDLPLPEKVDSAPYLSFGQKITDICCTGDTNSFCRFFDYEELLARAIDGLDVSYPSDQTIISQKVTLANSFVQSLKRRVKNRANIKMLAARRRGADVSLLFSAHGSDLTCSYFELFVENDPQGGFKIVDINMMMSGELTSETVRRLLITEHQISPAYLKKLNDKKKEAELKATFVYFHAPGSGTQADFEKLPAEMKKAKYAHLLYMQGLRSNLPEYLKALRACREAFPNDPSTELLNVEYYTLSGDFVESAKALEKINQQVGGDDDLIPIIEQVKANIRK